MSPERVTLTDDEMRVLRAHAPASVELGEWGRLIAPAVESILAAREQALREEIATDLLVLAEEYARQERAYAEGRTSYSEGARDAYDSAEAFLREAIHRMKEDR